MIGKAVSFYQSNVGRKVVMAVTGIILVGWILLHMLGNLQAFAGPGKLDEYAALLRKIGEILWAMRAVLLLAVILHIEAAWTLTRRSRASRPVGYRKRDPQASTVAARLMRWGGVLLLVFIVYHLLQFTFGPTHPDWPAFNHDTVYHNVTTAFHTGWIVAFYVLAMIALGLHLYHGANSMLLTLGLHHPRYMRGWRRVATVLALLIALGFVAVPLAVYAGVVQ